MSRGRWYSGRNEWVTVTSKITKEEAEAFKKILSGKSVNGELRRMIQGVIEDGKRN